MGLSLSGLKVFSVSEKIKKVLGESQQFSRAVIPTKIDDFPPRESVLPGHLGGDTQGVGQLGLPSPEFTEHLYEQKRFLFFGNI